MKNKSKSGNSGGSTFVKPENPDIILSHKCVICEDKIRIGSGGIIEREPIHYNCFKKNTRKETAEEIFKDLTKEVLENDLFAYRTSRNILDSVEKVKKKYLGATQ